MVVWESAWVGVKKNLIVSLLFVIYAVYAMLLTTYEDKSYVMWFYE
jgi:hypothetical protein